MEQSKAGSALKGEYGLEAMLALGDLSALLSGKSI